MYDKINKQTAFPLSRAVFVMGGVGAVIGAASAVAKNIPMVKNDEIDKSEAVKTVLKESAGGGFAAAAATAVIGAVAPRSGFLSLLGFAAVAVGTKILWDKAAYPAKPALPALKAEIKPEIKSEINSKEKDKKEEKKSLVEKKK